MEVRRRGAQAARRLAGNPRCEIYALTLGEAGTPVFTGLVAGLLACIAAARIIQKLLYGIRTVDPWVMLMVAALFLAAVPAVFVPARRAATVDPMEALRSELLF